MVGKRCTATVTVMRTVTVTAMTVAMVTVVARVTVAVALAMVTVAAADNTVAPAELRIGDFSAAEVGGDFPSPWQPLTFRKIDRHTNYQLVQDDDGVVVLQADADASASGLTREVNIDPAQYPIVEWRWKVAGVLDRGDVARKVGDDYPARLYITFAYDPAKVGLIERAKYRAAKLFYGKAPPSAAVNYLWASRAAVGTQVANAYTKRVQMFVLRSGAENAGRWQSESRNIYEDYRAAFGESPPRISGVAVMTDTDNTGERARAWFGDIVFKTRSPSPRYNRAVNPTTPSTCPPTPSTAWF